MINELLSSVKEALLPSGRTGTEDMVNNYERDPNERGQLADWLPYISYVEEHSIFVNTDTIGFCLEVRPQTGANEEMANILETVYSNLPPDTSVQWALFCTPHIESTLRQYANLRTEDPDLYDRSLPMGRPDRNDNVFRKMARRRVGFYKWGAHNSMIEGTSYKLRDFRLMFSFTMPAGVEEVYKRDEMLVIRDSLQSTLRNAGFPNNVVGAKGLINWVADILNPNRMQGDCIPLEYDSATEVRDQIVERDTRSLEVQDGMLLHKPGGEHAIEARLLTVMGFPRNFALWQMGGMIGDLFQSSLQLPCPFVISSGVFMLDPDKTKTKAYVQAANADREAKSKMAGILPHIAQKDQDWKHVTSSLSNGGKVVSMYHTIALFPKPDQATAAEQAAHAIWRSRGFTLNSCTYVQRTALLSTLPMIMSPAFHKDMRRMRLATTKTTHNAVNLAPMIGEWRGTDNPVMLFGGRRGQIIKLDFWDNPTGAANVAIAGATGTGKSVLINEIAQSYAGIGAKVWIYDLGLSFKKLCENVRGQYVRFEQGKPMCMNPFSMVAHFDQDYSMVHSVLMRMASPTSMLESIQAQALGNAINVVWGDYGRDATVTHVYNLMRTGRVLQDDPEDQRVRDVATMLRPYAEGGVYSRFFNGKHSVNFENDFIVIELEELKNQTHLRQVMLMILTYQVTVQMYLERHRKKICIIDEAKDFLASEGSDNSMMAKFIDDGFARARKYGGSFITATQGIDHYYLSAAGQSALNNADWMLLLRQKTEAIEMLGKNGRLVMDEAMKRMLCQQQTEQGKFSEIYVHGPGQLGSGLVRSLIDPYSLLMFSNRQQDNMPMDQKLAAGKDLDQAIQELLAERGQRAF